MNLLILLFMSTVIIDTLDITSPAFVQGGTIPEKYTCNGRNISPSLSVKKIPQRAQTIALIVEDPDAPRGTFDHWLVWNIPVSGGSLTIEENNAPGTQGSNGMGKNAYMGPCPPSGTHHYHFKVFALDTKLNLKAGSGKNTLIQAMQGHILGTGELIGMFGSH